MKLLRELRAIRVLLIVLIFLLAALLACAVPIGVVIWISLLG